jgi:hypothetical protein
VFTVLPKAIAIWVCLLSVVMLYSGHALGQQPPSGRNPRYNASISPKYNASINPKYNASLNPKYNASINPRYNAEVNPRYNPAINPRHNAW